MVKAQIITSDNEIDDFLAFVGQYPKMQIFLDYCCKLIKEDKDNKLRKAAFNPQKIVAALPYIVINEIIDENTVVIRLVGTEVETIFGGSSATGQNVINFLSDSVRQGASQFFHKTAENNLVSLQEEDLILASGKVIECNTLGFPMADEEGINRFRITVSHIAHKKLRLLEQPNFVIEENDIHAMRFVPSTELMKSYFRR